ncbi:MAG: M28 family peptidase, partial [Candidatus Heimdallarchaeota archaeon]|nr:M28 family peptidase [Candidatus Heimdallarchaeota archaeon]
MENNLGLTNVDFEKLYSHVYELEGIRHPLTYPIGLERAAKYIEKELESYGYITERQFFELPGFDEPFYNIQGYFSDGASSDVLVTSHYDTVHNTPGADDSASSVAIMLETARIISDTEYKNRLKVISFTLEEGNPIHEQAANIQAQLCGLIDDQLRPTSFGALEKINLM